MLVKEITRGIVWMRTGIANSYLVESEEHGWVLLDSGTPGHAGKIRAAAEARFGRGARPSAIILSHGHFDHAGSARALADKWDVEVFAHPMEAPYLTGKSPYPPPDPTVGGCMGFASRFFPSTTTNVGTRLSDLPPGGHVPGLPGWRWYSTPGHSPGHVSYFHEKSSVLLSGDAVISVDMDSCSAMASQKPEISRPPLITRATGSVRVSRWSSWRNCGRTRSAAGTGSRWLGRRLHYSCGGWRGNFPCRRAGTRCIRRERTGTGSFIFLRRLQTRWRGSHPPWS